MKGNQPGESSQRGNTRHEVALNGLERGKCGHAGEGSEAGDASSEADLQARGRVCA